MVLDTTVAAFIGASVTLILVIIFMILMVILVRQCLSFMAKRNAIREQMERHRRAREELERQRRASISEPVNPTFDWHHSIRVAGTPPPSYREAKELPAIGQEAKEQDKLTSSDGIVILATDKAGLDEETHLHSLDPADSQEEQQETPPSSPEPNRDAGTVCAVSET